MKQFDKILVLFAIFAFFIVNAYSAEYKILKMDGSIVKIAGKTYSQNDKVVVKKGITVTDWCQSTYIKIEDTKTGKQRFIFKKNMKRRSILAYIASLWPLSSRGVDDISSYLSSEPFMFLYETDEDSISQSYDFKVPQNIVLDEQHYMQMIPKYETSLPSVILSQDLLNNGEHIVHIRFCDFINLYPTHNSVLYRVVYCNEVDNKHILITDNCSIEIVGQSTDLIQQQ